MTLKSTVERLIINGVSSRISSSFFMHCRLLEKCLLGRKSYLATIPLVVTGEIALSPYCYRHSSVCDHHTHENFTSLASDT